MCIESKTLCPTLKGCKCEYLVFHRKRLEPRVLRWQQQWVSFCFFCDVVFWCQVWKTLLQYFWRYSWFSILLFECNLWRHHFAHLHNAKKWISLKRKKIFQKGKRHSSLLLKAFQISSNYFLLHGHFKESVHFKVETVLQDIFSHLLKLEQKKWNSLWNREN